MTTPTQHPASTSDARKRTADLVTPDRGSDLRESLDLDAIKGRLLAARPEAAASVVIPTPESYAARLHLVDHDVPALLAEVERLRAWGARAKREAEARAEKAERAFRELRSKSRILPCDGACADAPEEDCSRHGREPVDLWRIIGEARAERDAAREALARAEALDLVCADGCVGPGLCDGSCIRAALDYPAGTAYDALEALAALIDQTKED